MQFEKTLRMEQRKGIAMRHCPVFLDSEMLTVWFAHLVTSCVSCTGQLGGAGESPRLGHAGPAEGPGRAG